MQDSLQAMTDAPPERAPELLRQLVASMRPRRADDAQAAINSVQALAFFLLEQSPAWRAGLRRTLLRVLSNRQQVQFYADTGILSNESFFFSALSRRIGDRILPPAPNPHSLRDLFGSVFFFAITITSGLKPCRSKSGSSSATPCISKKNTIRTA